MSICRCCGQHIEAATQTPPASDVVRVDDDVLAACNKAFELARERGHAHVEVAHVVLAVAMSDAGAAVLARHGQSAQQAGRAADAWLSSWAQVRATGQALSTSADLKQILRQGEQLAQRASRSHASLDDVLSAVSSQGGTLWSASFWTAATYDLAVMRSVRSEASVDVAQMVAPPSRDVSRAPETSQPPAPTQSLLDRDYAWLRDMKHSPAASGAQAASQATSASSAASVAGSARATSTPAPANSLVSLVAGTPRTRNPKDPRDAASPASGRVMHLFASPPATAPVPAPASAPAAARDDTASRAILQRLESQERTLGQRLDTQQRMIADLAEAFARSMRELAQARSDAAAALARMTGREARTSEISSERSGEGAGASSSSRGSSGGSSASRSHSGGSDRSRPARGSWRRQSWSAWRRRRQADADRNRTPADSNANRAWNSWPDHEREPWAARERAPRAEREPREERTPRPGLTPRDDAQAAPLYSAQPIPPRVDATDSDEPNGREKRFYLALDDEIEKAPSIGPRTAAALNIAGLMTVRDLLTCDPRTIAARLNNRYITAERLTQWQAQSRLVCTIPWLRGTHAQLLAGAGYDTVEKIVAADAPSVCAAILKFAATRDGMGVLRSSPPPGEDWVIKRLEHARAAEPERAVA